MITFVVLAAVLTVAVVAVVAWPLLRKAVDKSAPAPWTAMGATLVLVIGSAMLYATWSNWSWKKAPLGDSAQSMVARLARTLESNPNNVQGWLMLGRSYTVLEQYPLAARSFDRADRLAGGKNSQALVGEAEALILSDENQLDGRAGKLIERALTLDPNSAKALFFGGAAAVRKGDLPTARERFVRLLALNPPDNVKPLIQQQVTAIDAKLGAAAQAGGTSRADQEAVEGRQQLSGASAAAVRVTVSLSPTLSISINGGQPLFVFVRDPTQSGPPLAAKRLASHFPQTVELTPSDAMVPGRTFSAGQKVQVVARIARSGNPLAGSGDPFGEVAYQVGHDGLVDVVIDRLTP